MNSLSIPLNWHLACLIRSPTTPEKENIMKDFETNVSAHAKKRMCQRRISLESVDAALRYGREVFTRGAITYAIGRKEVSRWKKEGVCLTSHEGIQVVCSIQGFVITTYRNRSFCKLRAGMGRGRFSPKSKRQLSQAN